MLLTTVAVGNHRSLSKEGRIFLVYPLWYSR